ncbi:hypothetical protein [Paenibacillus lutimineralis]|uniref:WD40 repeat domain-containing protein n=1 Tax=Paenibacillus lutimineralis TaxID=2707005 RepID=A0A3Q9IC00_9BACL|nr:hypothetical protein [Paenibacillus lutimineralis]AZS15684.1 hypothetical protein EI981_15365 [Paenibacillus lutimineralis]
MRKQLFTILVLMCTALLLTACFKNGESIDAGKKIAQAENNTVKENGFGQKQPNNTNDANRVEDIFHDLNFDYKTNRLVLSDLKTNAELESITLDKNSFAKNIMKWDQGYAVEVLLADKPVQVKQSSGLEIISTPQKVNGKLVRIYNEKLKLQKEIDLTQALPKELIENEPFTAISNDGSKIVWANIMNLYLYDIDSGELSTVFDDTNNQVIFEKIVFTQDNNKVVFFGSQADHAEGELSYGIIELGAKKITVHTEKQYQGSDIQISDRYASITDVINPVNNTSSGKVLIVDVQTGEASLMKVDGTESTMARVTEDGKYLIAVNQEDEINYRIRQYKLKTGDMVKEEKFKPVKQESKALRIDPSINPAVYNLIVFAGSEYYFLSFVSEE